MKTAENIGNHTGPTPGPKGVIKQHKVMASGYELPTPERRNMVPGLKGSKTGEAVVPGFSNVRKTRK